jgi:hypothetical protein
MDFNFISDEQFRSSLIADFSELNACIEASSWKAVHVLAGSIIEAVLTEYLVVSNIQPKGKNPLTLTLDEAIQACTAAKVLQKSTASLCDVVREYRNLIHPGRMIRLSQEVTSERANIAVNLVALIVKEIAEKRKETYGPTAEQIVKKLRTDQHSLGVLSQLLLEANAHERSKLVRRLIPEAYTEINTDTFNFDIEILTRLRAAYRQAFDLLEPSLQREIASTFAKTIREESDEKIESHGEAFFIASDLSLLSSQDASLVVGYLKNRLETIQGALTDGIMRQTINLGCYIDKAEIANFTDLLVRIVLRQPKAVCGKVIDWAEMAFDVLDTDKRAIMEKRIEVWVKFAKEKEFSGEQQERLAKLEMKWIDIPF